MFQRSLLLLICLKWISPELLLLRLLFVPYWRGRNVTKVWFAALSGRAPDMDGVGEKFGKHFNTHAIASTDTLFICSYSIQLSTYILLAAQTMCSATKKNNIDAQTTKYWQIAYRIHCSKNRDGRMCAAAAAAATQHRHFQIQSRIVFCLLQCILFAWRGYVEQSDRLIWMVETTKIDIK